jgi:SAM-dependent methyltransferase
MQAVASAVDAKTTLRPAGSSSVPDAHAPACRFCATPLAHTFVDLGTSPLCQRHVKPADFNKAEAFYPLHVYVCDKCWLVQLPEYVAADQIFDDQYAYFSSFSDTMLHHAQAYVEMISEKLSLGPKSRVVEVASNDGYLLQYFVKRGVPALGIEPTANTAAAAEKKGVPSLVKFFGRRTAHEVKASHGHADLILGNNVLAHVPDINDFVGGLKALLAPTGVVTMEFPQLLHLIEQNYFDTIYHEHFSYLSFSTVETIFAEHGLTLFDVDEIDTHGGSIRIYAKQASDTTKPVTPHVAMMKQREEKAGHRRVEYYQSFGERVKETKRKLLEFLIAAKRQGKSVAGYGAPGKGNTLLNYCGIRTDFLEYTVDRSPHKYGNYLPGTRIPIHHPDKVRETKPDYLLILPWNLREEIIKQMAHVREWGGKFVVPIPEVKVFD